MTFEETHRNSNGHERARGIGLESYDTSLPQDWYDKVFEHCDKNPCGHVVWCYDDFDGGTANIFGYPVAITQTGRQILGIMATKTVLY